MAARAQTLICNSRCDLKQFAKGLCSGADPYMASLTKYFICTNIYDEAFMEYPYKGWQNLVDHFCVVVDKCDNLQVFEIYRDVFTSMEEVEVIASTIKELAGQALGHHPNLTRLVQYGSANVTTNAWYVKWALIGKDNSGLGGWTPNNDSNSERTQGSISGRQEASDDAGTEERERNMMMSEMGGSYENDPDSSDEDAANTDEEEADDEGNTDQKGTDADGDGADSDNNDGGDDDDEPEPEPEADDEDEDEDEELGENGNHLNRPADMMDENATRIKRQRVD